MPCICLMIVSPTLKKILSKSMHTTAYMSCRDIVNRFVFAFEVLPKVTGSYWAPLDELRAPVLLSTNELLWLPRSARRADGDETRSRAKSGEAGDWADRNAAFCCSFCSRRSHLTHATGHFSPAASGRSFISPLVFLAQGAPKQSARNQGAPRFSDTVVCLRSDCPSFPAAAPDQQQLQGCRARAGGAAVKERQHGEG